MRRTPYEAATALGRAAVRGAALLTAPARPLPEFLLVGAKRGGSTAAFYQLLEHPQVLPMFPSGRTPLKRDHTKGVHHFAPGTPRSTMWYRSHFPSVLARARAARAAGGPVVTGEGSPYYLFHPLAAGRAAAVLPHARILVVLRDPVERTASHHREQRRNGVEPLPLEEALAAEDARLAGEEERILADPSYVSFAHEHQSYRAQSEYGRALLRWYGAFPRDQVLVVASEDLFATPQPVFDRVCAFLGIAPFAVPALPVRNAADGTPVDPGTVRALRRHFAADVALVEDLVGVGMPWGRPR